MFDNNGFSKKFMSISELKKMGLSKNTLLDLAHKRNQKCAMRTPGGGKIIFDTTKLQKELEKLFVR